MQNRKNRALGRSTAWLLGACVALGACAEPAAPASVALGAAAGAPASTRATATVRPESRTASPSSAPATASTEAHADHAAAPPASAGGVETSGRANAGAVAVDASLPRMQVHKSPTCGCCALWVDHVREAGFAVEVHDTHDLAAVKSRLGVPADAQSCHTAEVGGLVVEGHVPAHDIKRALAQRDGTRALLLPGMPLNSPGMEVPGVNAPAYTVERIKADGTREPFATHGE